MADFWRTFHHDGKISLAWWVWRGACPPPFTLSTIKSKVVVYAPDTLPPFLLYPYVFSVVWAIKSTKTAAWRKFSNFAKLHNKPDKCVNLGKMLHDVSRVLGQKYLFLTRIVWEEFCPRQGEGAWIKYRYRWQRILKQLLAFLEIFTGRKLLRHRASSLPSCVNVADLTLLCGMGR